MNIPGLDLPSLPDASRLTLPLGDVTLGGYLWEQPHHAPAAVLLHGWGQDASDMACPARLFHQAGWHVLSLSLRGWRGSSGCDDYGRSGPGDTLRVLEWLRDRPDVTSTVLLGFSLGGLVALLTAVREHPARLVVAVNAPTDLRGVYRTTTSRILRCYYEAVLTEAQWEEGSPIRWAGRLRTPARVVVGTEDHLCPPAVGREFARASGAGLLEVDGMAHLPNEAEWGLIVRAALAGELG
ncbi:alpha/beta hydrolase family protein [Deinococcus apachensis]|uniref:alpha/beta hydrolase family protein n=1 Tax=Deinococcus apachensis TaxID=309886 RepID=UPI00037BAA6B|nr:alpha/beta fold hydrolase [Deinococcus apachensis]